MRLLLAVLAVAMAAAQPLRLHPENPHYFLFDGKPAVLITSGEHYGAVLNRDFDFVRYLDTLRADRLNLTRMFSGSYREVPGNFAIAANTLAPAPGRFIAPWLQREGKFDLTKWDDAYFARLKDFVTYARRSGVVVEVVLFCPLYEDSMWSVSPMNARNNVNGIGEVARTDVLALKDERLTEVQDAMVRKIVSELRDFDNIYYEICNEPYFQGVTLAWQEHISKTIAQSEAGFTKRHLIAQNWANGSSVIDRPNPLVDLFNFHYSRPPASVAMNRSLNRAIGNNETGFDGAADATYRIQGWDFLMAGGALYNNLDYGFTVGHEDGTFTPPAATPGGGSVALRRQLGHLRAFFDEIPFWRMQPSAEGMVRGPEGATARALEEPGKVYAVYVHHGRIVRDAKPRYQVDATAMARPITLQLPPGAYTARWRDTRSGLEVKVENVRGERPGRGGTADLSRLLRRHRSAGSTGSRRAAPVTRSSQEEWLWGWDPTPGIVSVWAEADGRAVVWRRSPETGELMREEALFRPWLVLARIDDLQHLGTQLGRDGTPDTLVSYRELEGPGALRYLVSAVDGRTLAAAVLEGATRRLGRRVGHLRDLGKDAILALPPEEQYLVATGRTYFRGLAFDHLRRMQFDLETTGLDPAHDRIFMVAVREPSGATELLEAGGDGDAGEAELIRRLVAKVKAADPDVIENHNLHGFDLPFLDRRARMLGVPLALGRIGPPGLRQRGARRGASGGADTSRRIRFVAPGRELIDTLDAVLRYDFATRDLPNHGLKAVARHLGIAGPNREYIRGDQIHAVYRRDPARVRRYATADVEEVAGLARMLGGAAFALAQMTPRRYERLADAGAATGVIDPLLVRAYLRAGMALPAHQPGDGTPHSGAALHLFATGVARRVVKADVASLYPSLMRAYRIGPARDHLGAMLALVDRLVELRLSAKASARAAPPGSAARYAHEAMSAAMKLVVNSAYGYLAAGGELTRFADVHAANEVTRRGRDTLRLMCRELAARGVTLLEADTDGVYFAVPETWGEADERRVVAEVAALLPALVHLEFDGRYAAMLSHEPKNYALLGYDGSLLLRGVAFRSSRAEPFGEAFLRRATARLLAGDTGGVRDIYVATLDSLRRHQLPAYDVSSRVRLTKTPAQYLETRETRRELPYEAMLASGRTSWSAGDRIRVYRTKSGSGGVIEESEDEAVASGESANRRDYDADHYARVLRETFAARLERAFTPADYEALFADPDQMSLFTPPVATIRTVLIPQPGEPQPG